MKLVAAYLEVMRRAGNFQLAGLDRSCVPTDT
jgi:hypothetical protein